MKDNGELTTEDWDDSVVEVVLDSGERGGTWGSPFYCRHDDLQRVVKIFTDWRNDILLYEQQTHNNRYFLRATNATATFWFGKNISGLVYLAACASTLKASCAGIGWYEGWRLAERNNNQLDHWVDEGHDGRGDNEKDRPQNGISHGDKRVLDKKGHQCLPLLLPCPLEISFVLYVLFLVGTGRKISTILL